MNVDKWFEKKSKKYQIISLLIPVYGWAIEVLIRLSLVIKKPKLINWIGLIVFGLFGVGWFPELLDVLYCVFVSKDNKLLLVEPFTDEEEEAYLQKLEEQKEESIKHLDRSKLKEKEKDVSDSDLYDLMLLHRMHAIVKLIGCFIGWTFICLGFKWGGFGLIVFGILIMAAPSIVKAFGVMGGGAGLFDSASTTIRTYDVYQDGHKVETTTVGDTIGGHILGFILHILLTVLLGAILSPLELIFDSLKYWRLAGMFHRHQRTILLAVDVAALVYAVAIFIIMIMVAIH